MRRTINSGPVFFVPTDFMILRRCSGLRVSAMLYKTQSTTPQSTEKIDTATPLQLYTPPRTITLDAATEERIQRQLDRGAFPGPTELLAHALDLLEEEKAAEDWLDRNMDAINADLDESLAQTARGETSSSEESLADLAQHRAARDLNRLI